ncbi:glycoside hydrolase family 9 protein [Aquimarina pacifica]|uniref:glycoside hydrolase family 9 protein n=1 Tax=Aquimarina pacifica TaxID=1296415 RepID=UPI00046EEECD|nr:glycoside hydrolase family 9 protein [Aquimarina pacifica]
MKNSIFKQTLFLFLTLSTYTISAQFDYEDALEKSIYFFDANKCGPNVAEDNVFSWRGACHIDDGSEVGQDLTGGFHDAGGHVKYGLPQAWSAATLGFALYEFRESFDQSGTTTKLLSTLKYFSDYFLRSHTSIDTFYFNVGDGREDHSTWGSPETQIGARPITVADTTTPASDVCGQTAAALALMYLNYRDIDLVYSEQCLQAAIEIYELGKDHLGYSDNGNGDGLYRSFSYYDDLIWGAIWLSVATEDESYLDPVDAWLEIPGELGLNGYTYEWAPVWDNSYLYSFAKLYDLTGIDKYQDAVLANFDWFLNDNYSTPGGISWLSQFGPLRYVASEAGLGFLAAKFFDYTDYVQVGNSDIDYILGDNPRGSSYITGWGNNPPQHPHHRANEPDLTSGVTNGIVGAMVGGPDRNDQFYDDVLDFQKGEVSIDFNSSLILGLAGKIYTSQGQINVPPTVEFSELASGDIVTIGTSVNLSVIAADSDGDISSVKFWIDGVLFGEDTSEPYSLEWTPLEKKEYQIRVQAFDNNNASTSSTITISSERACDFGTPLGTSLPSTGYTSYNKNYVLGTGGPDLSNVIDFVVNWNLQNNGLYQFSMLTNNGVPAWWNDFIPKMSHNFSETEPSITIMNSGFTDLDGSYYVTMDGDNFALVSMNEEFTIYFSNSDIEPNCNSSKSVISEVSSKNTTPIWFPNPIKDVLTIQNLKDFHRIIVLDVLGKEVVNQENNVDQMLLNFEGQKSGVYILQCIKKDGNSVESVLVRE